MSLAYKLSGPAFLLFVAASAPVTAPAADVRLTATLVNSRIKVALINDGTDICLLSVPGLASAPYQPSFEFLLDQEKQGVPPIALMLRDQNQSKGSNSKSLVVALSAGLEYAFTFPLDDIVQEARPAESLTAVKPPWILKVRFKAESNPDYLALWRKYHPPGSATRGTLYEHPIPFWIGTLMT